VLSIAFTWTYSQILVLSMNKMNLTIRAKDKVQQLPLNRKTVLQYNLLALMSFLTIIRINNTPPATRKISALRGVNYFYSMIKGLHHAVF